MQGWLRYKYAQLFPKEIIIEFLRESRGSGVVIIAETESVAPDNAGPLTAQSRRTASFVLCVCTRAHMCLCVCSHIYRFRAEFNI